MICETRHGHTAPVKPAHYRLDAEPDEGNVSRKQVERTALRIRLTIHPPLELKAGVKTATCGMADLPAKA